MGPYRQHAAADVTHVAHDRRRREEALEMSWNIEGREVDISSVRRPFSNIHEKVIHIDRGRRHRSLARSLPSAKTSLGLAKHRQVGEGEGRRVGKWQKNYWRPRGIIILLTVRPLPSSGGRRGVLF